MTEKEVLLSSFRREGIAFEEDGPCFTTTYLYVESGENYVCFSFNGNDQLYRVSVHALGE